MKFEKLRPGMVLYEVGRHTMGNTTMSTVAVWRVQIVSVDAEKRSAVASWNSNTPRTYYPKQLAKLREKKPLLVKTGLGMRLANREEKKAARAAVGDAERRINRRA